ncbi:IclR family transcriptional regulator [Janibacter sp. CX7]|uniref:IclR family transcriptional regulator n=1 Tax=Janibacter sp. CX7 TaxID=2963431 RepID=UPI0020CF9BBB|nr:IclR family transcriptional regulator [Janibacter sp. CX7]UTT66529.1 IclR family transcriptional regulator [Janibacter sp. CX7]
MSAIGTAIRVLEGVAAHQPVGVGELARRLKIPKSTVQRALNELADVSWIEPAAGSATTRWVVTTRALAVAAQGGPQLRTENVRRAMVALRDEFNENVHLTVRHGDVIVIVDKVESTHGVRVYDPLGIPVPMHASSSGKALLAAATPEDRAAYVDRALEQFTDRTLVDPDALLEELDGIRERGYSINTGEWRASVSGVAAAIPTRGGPEAALAIAAPTERITAEQIASMGPRLLEVVADIARWDLG